MTLKLRTVGVTQRTAAQKLRDHNWRTWKIWVRPRAVPSRCYHRTLRTGVSNLFVLGFLSASWATTAGYRFYRQDTPNKSYFVFSRNAVRSNIYSRRDYASI